MKSIKHLIGASAILMLAFAFNGCTTDSDVVQIAENELESEDIGSSSSSEKAETKAKSSSSKKEAKSSSSKKENKEKAEDAESKDKSSSSVKDDDSKVSSSSKADDKEEAKSSSSARKIRVPGIEDPDEVTPASSSSKEKDKSSSSVKEQAKSSSSNKEAVKDTIDKDTTSVIKDNNEMDKLDSNEQEILDSLISSGDTSITKIDSLVIDKDSLDFDNNEYLCKAPDGNWYRLNESKAKTFWKLLWDLTVYIFTGHHYYDFTKACDELYMRPKN